MTSPLEAALLVAVMAGLFYFVVMTIADRLDDPDYLRTQGVVIVREEVLAPAEPIGEYRGHPIWAAVRFKGLRYRFDHIVPPSHRDRIQPGELYVEPGLVYTLEA